MAGLPFEGPIGAVRMGLIGAEWVVNPTFQDAEEATFDIVVAGRRNDAGKIDVLMIEGEAPENTWKLIADGSSAPTEEVVAEGLEAAKRAIGEVIDFQSEFLGMLDVQAQPFEPKKSFTDEVATAVEAFAKGRLDGALVPQKNEREAKLSELKDELKEHLRQTWGEDKFAEVAAQVSPAFKDLQKSVMRKKVIDEGIRLDGRTATELRPLSAIVGVLPRAHGSAVFQRGDTQALNITTLGMLRMTQMIDTLDLEESKRYMHHYNMPPFSNGETGRIGSPSAGRSVTVHSRSARLIPVIPSEEEFPYTLRLVSDDPEFERIHVDGERLLVGAVPDGRGRSDQGAGRGYRDGHDRRGRHVRDADRHPGRGGRARRHGLQGRGHATSSSRRSSST